MTEREQWQNLARRAVRMMLAKLPADALSDPEDPCSEVFRDLKKFAAAGNLAAAEEDARRNWREKRIGQLTGMLAAYSMGLTDGGKKAAEVLALDPREEEAAALKAAMPAPMPDSPLAHRLASVSQ